MAPTVPETAEGLREALSDRRTLKALFEDGEFEDFIEDHVQARLKKDPEITGQVEMQVEKFKRDWLKDLKGTGTHDDIAHRLNLATPTAKQHYRKGAIYNKKAIGAKHDGAFDTLGDMLHGISNFGYKNDSMSRKLESLSNDLSSIKPSDGGFLIPEILRATILSTALEKAVVRPRARVIPMDSLTVPFPTVDSTSNVSSVFGGIVGYWTEEGATLTESQPRFGRVTLHANKLTLYTEVPNELIRDALPSMNAFLNEIFPEAVAWYEDVAFFIGGGVGEPLGFLNAPCAVAPTRSTTVAGDNVEWVDIVNMYSRMLPQSLDTAVWIVAPDVLPSLLTMTVGSGNQAVWIGGGTRPDGSATPPMSMLGRPLIVSEKAKTVGDAGDINFVDFSYYLLGDRQAMSARQSEEFRFQNDLTAFRVIERLDGRPWLETAITPQNNASNTLSPFVSLTAAP